MIIQTIKRFPLVIVTLGLLAPGLLFITLPGVGLSRPWQKPKSFTTWMGKDPDVAKYAMALINKHIEAEGGARQN